jgi:hypothetical protein
MLQRRGLSGDKKVERAAHLKVPISGDPKSVAGTAEVFSLIQRERTSDPSASDQRIITKGEKAYHARNEADLSLEARNSPSFTRVVWVIIRPFCKVWILCSDPLEHLGVREHLTVRPFVAREGHIPVSGDENDPSLSVQDVRRSQKRAEARTKEGEGGRKEKETDSMNRTSTFISLVSSTKSVISSSLKFFMTTTLSFVVRP